MSVENHPDPDQKKIVNLYGAFGASIILSVLPYAVAAGVSMVLMLGVMIAAYRMRAKASKDSLMTNHMTFVIRTIWIGGFVALITLTIGSIYLLSYIDNAPLNPCIQKLMNAPIPLDQLNAIMKVFESCMGPFLKVNFMIFLASGLITAGPPLLYFIIRYARGLSRALRGYRISKPEILL